MRSSERKFFCSGMTAVPVHACLHQNGLHLLLLRVLQTILSFC